MLLWQNAYDPKKKTQHMLNKPKLFVPDFMKTKREGEVNKDSEAMSVDDIKSILNQPRGV